VGATPHALDAGTSVIELTLQSGENRFDIAVADGAGNEGLDATRAITRDDEAPEIQVYGPSPGMRVEVAAVQVSGNAGPGSTVTVDGDPVSVTATGDFQVTVSLDLGTNVIRIEAVDPVGNNASRSVTVEYELPAQPPPAPASGGMEIPMLLAGLAAGAVVGAFAMRGRGRPPAASGGPAPQADEAPTESPTPARGPKGPRGPAPPE
jgi:hypothetical protein